MDHSAGLTGKTSLEKKNIVSAKKQLLLKKQKKAPLGRCRYVYIYMGVSKYNNGTPKSSILIGFGTIIKHPFWGTPIFGNTHTIYIYYMCKYINYIICNYILAMAIFHISHVTYLKYAYIYEDAGCVGWFLKVELPAIPTKHGHPEASAIVNVWPSRNRSRALHVEAGTFQAVVSQLLGVLELIVY